jgi:hypothetical protein
LPGQRGGKAKKLVENRTLAGICEKRYPAIKWPRSTDAEFTYRDRISVDLAAKPPEGVWRIRMERVSAIDSQGRTIWIVDAHRNDGKRFVVRADEKLTAFVELESATRGLPPSHL